MWIQLKQNGIPRLINTDLVREARASEDAHTQGCLSLQFLNGHQALYDNSFGGYAATVNSRDCDQ